MFNRSLTVLSVLAMMAPIASAQVRWKPYDPAVVAPQGACSVALSVPQDRIATERQISTQEINPYFGPYWLVFNVIEAVFASGREREAQRNILPIRAALEGDDTAARFHQALSRARSSLPCLVEGDVVRAEGAKPARSSPAFTLDGTGMLWLVRVRYSMSSDSRYLTAHATSTLLPAEARGLLT
jgi:hypothetical protein